MTNTQHFSIARKTRLKKYPTEPFLLTFFSCCVFPYVKPPKIKSEIISKLVN